MARDWKNFPEVRNSKMDMLYWESPHKQVMNSFPAVCTKVHDGDTITVDWNERDFTFPIRLIGIDAPELNADRGHEVRNWLKDEIEGKEVYVLVDPKNRVGKWGRILGKIIFRGIDMNDTMLRMGLVTTFLNRREGQIPPLKLENIKIWR